MSKIDLNPYQDELNLLKKAVEPELFRLVFIQHNNFPLKDAIKDYLIEQFPQRKHVSFTSEGSNYREMMDAILGNGSGFVFIDDFDYLIKDEGMYPGLNMRRDKIAGYPVSLICFLLKSNETMRTVMNNIPDMYSFRNLIQEYVYNKEENELPEAKSLQSDSEYSSLGGTNPESKKKELVRLEKEISALGESPDELPLKYNLCRQAAAIYNDLGYYQKAIDYNEKALNIALKRFGEEHSDVAKSYNDLGRDWDHLKKYKTAIAYFEKALTIDKKNFGKESRAVGSDYLNLGLAWNDLEVYKKAIEYLEKGLVLSKKNFGEEHFYVAINYNQLGEAWANWGEHNKAFEYFEKALAIIKKNFGDKSLVISEYYNNFGMASFNLGEYIRAIENFEKALVIDIKNLGKEHPQIATYYNNLGVAWNNLGEYNKAIKYYEKALKNYRKILVIEEHPRIKTIKENIATARAALEKQGK